MALKVRALPVENNSNLLDVVEIFLLVQSQNWFKISQINNLFCR